MPIEFTPSASIKFVDFSSHETLYTPCGVNVVSPWGIDLNEDFLSVADPEDDVIDVRKTHIVEREIGNVVVYYRLTFHMIDYGCIFLFVNENVLLIKFQLILLQFHILELVIEIAGNVANIMHIIYI